MEQQIRRNYPKCIVVLHGCSNPIREGLKRISAALDFSKESCTTFPSGSVTESVILRSSKILSSFRLTRLAKHFFSLIFLMISISACYFRGNKKNCSLFKPKILLKCERNSLIFEEVNLNVQ